MADQRGFDLRAGSYKAGGWHRRSGALPLDGRTANGWAALSVNKLVTAYAGPCIMARRSSDNTTLDMGFVGSALDVSALLAFCGAGDGFVSIMYDQFGHGNHFIQPTLATQPKIVTAGAYLGKVVFDGVNDLLASTNLSTAPGTTALSTFLRGLDRNPAAFGIPYELSSDYATQTGAIAESFGANYIIGLGDVIVNLIGIFPSVLNNNVLGSRFDRLAGTSATQLAHWQASVNVVASSFSGSFALTQFGGNTWYLGSRSSGIPCPLDLTTFVIYETALVDADMVSYSTALT